MQNTLQRQVVLQLHDDRLADQRLEEREEMHLLLGSPRASLSRDFPAREKRSLEKSAKGRVNRRTFGRMAVAYGGPNMLRPSFFEVAAADQLIQGLKPALHHILRSIADHAPSFSVLEARSDEVFYLLTFLLDRRYLQTQNASFAENFYCLKRVKLNSDGSTSPLQSEDRFFAILCLAGVPYLRCKLETFYLETKEESITSPQTLRDGSLLSAFKKLYLKVYPYAASLYEGLEYIHAVRYVMGNTWHFSPLTPLLSQRVQRLSLEDMMAKRGGGSRSRIPSTPNTLHPPSPLDRAWDEEPGGGGAAGGGGRGSRSARLNILRRILAFLSRIGGAVADNARWAVYIGVFAIRFLQWWYSPENQQRNSRPAAPPPP
eukprot:CAMPEP_0197520846 /NCGR_PEP_ID=MMETSP1318-20131121/6179_1 /TAXON_ID=552666 /ORGANISM="Partenskyella glossopodia, Strain RCC365" /LENGTH=373 /DNA_ID=CAMNT_0043072595 /DNA_START=392 /DNA_END=1510 /DNA_ORIENTATION=+